METSRCPLCRARTLTGHEDVNAAALPYRLDPDPLDALMELDALHSGRLSWTVDQTMRGRLVRLRSVQAIRAGRSPRQTVHADHRCEGT